MSFKEFYNGLKSYAKAHRLIIKYKLWPYLAIPGILSICYIIFLIILGSNYLPGMSEYVNESLIPEFLQGDVMETVLSIFLWIFLLLIGYISYREVVLILFSPVLSFISEKVETVVYNREALPFNIKNIISDIIRGIKIEAKSIVKMIIYTIIAWLLVLIPVIGAVISPVIILLIQSYYGGLRFVDYTLERKRYSVEESLFFVRSNKANITGVGIGFVLILMIPVLGWFLAPSYGTVAATLSTLEKLNKNDTELLEL